MTATRPRSTLTRTSAPWDTSGVTTMYLMFYGASAFNQDLGWCVDNDVNMGWGPNWLFGSTPCLSALCERLVGRL